MDDNIVINEDIVVKDFTFTIYRKLLKTFIEVGYQIASYEQFCLTNTSNRCVILRHDVDRKPQNALLMARIEGELNVKSSYYFRIINSCYRPQIIHQIVQLGHELGYHYEDLAMMGGDYKKALKVFEKNLIKFRKFYPVKTISMHGSPLSRFNNSLLWQKYNYKDYGLIAEPSYDLDYNEVFYITDASRAWNNYNISIRDKVKSRFNYRIKSIYDILGLIKNDRLPPKIMLNIHPHNWSNNALEWAYVLCKQTFKNQFKRIVVKFNKN